MLISPLCGQLFPELPRGKENQLISNSNLAESGAQNSGSDSKTELLLQEKQPIPGETRRERGEEGAVRQKQTNRRGDRNIHVDANEHDDPAFLKTTGRHAKPNLRFRDAHVTV